MGRIGRRELLRGGLALAGAGLLAGCGVSPVPPRVRRIGVLFPGSPPVQPAPPGLLSALRDGLVERGWAEGRTFALEPRWYGERPEQLPAVVDELLRLPVDVLMAAGSAPAAAARRASDTVPIVLVNVPDPVELGLVESLAHPGGNVTGLTGIPGGFSTGKRLELLKALVPTLSRVAILTIPTPSSRAAAAGAQGPGRALNVDLLIAEARTLDDVEGPFEAAARQGADGLLDNAASLTLNHRARVAELAAAYRLPSMHTQRDLPAAGCFASYGPNLTAMWRYAATYVDKILNGTSPADLPVEQPSTFDFVVNLKTAQALGLTVPPSVLQQATEVIR